MSDNHEDPQATHRPHVATDRERRSSLLGMAQSFALATISAAVSHRLGMLGPPMSAQRAHDLRFSRRYRPGIVPPTNGDREVARRQRQIAAGKLSPVASIKAPALKAAA